MIKLILISSLVCTSLQFRLKSGYDSGSKSPVLSKWMKYMIGEQFFKDHDSSEEDLESYDEDLETIPYQVVRKEKTYEQRYYPSAIYICNKTLNIDTAADPFGGLENMNPYKLMSSKRWRNHHTSHMFMELFKYISGVNKNSESMEMTTPVVTSHHLVKKDPLGNYENQEMCFYLPSKYQGNHQHHNEDHEHHNEDHEHHEEDHDHQEDRHGRHVALPPPPPLNDNVYLVTRPEMYVFVRKFGGFALTYDSWETQKDALEADLLHDRHKYDLEEYATVGYDDPWKLTKRRNEVWIKCLDEHSQFPAPAVEEQLKN